MSESSIELSPEVRHILEELIETWADETLVGRPAILGTAMYSQIEKLLCATTEKILIAYPTSEQSSN